MHIWDIHSPHCVHVVQHVDGLTHTRIQRLSFNIHTGRVVLAARRLLAWQQIVYSRQNFIGDQCNVETVLYQAASKPIFNIDLAGVVNVWHARSGASVLRFTAEHADSVTCACLDTRERKLITGSLDGLIKVWNVNTGWLLGVYKTDGTRVPVLALSAYSGTDSPNTPSQPQSTNMNKALAITAAVLPTLPHSTQPHCVKGEYPHRSLSNFLLVSHSRSRE